MEFVAWILVGAIASYLAVSNWSGWVGFVVLWAVSALLAFCVAAAQQFAGLALGLSTELLNFLALSLPANLFAYPTFYLLWRARRNRGR